MSLNEAGDRGTSLKGPCKGVQISCGLTDMKRKILYFFKLPNTDASFICLVQIQLCATALMNPNPGASPLPIHLYQSGASTHGPAAVSVGGYQLIDVALLQKTALS